MKGPQPREPSGWTLGVGEHTFFFARPTREGFLERTSTALLILSDGTLGGTILCPQGLGLG